MLSPVLLWDGNGRNNQ